MRINKLELNFIEDKIAKTKDLITKNQDKIAKLQSDYEELKAELEIYRNIQAFINSELKGDK